MGHPEMDSVAELGQKSIISDNLDDLEGKEFTTVSTWDGTSVRAASWFFALENVPKKGDYVTRKRVVYDKATLTITDHSYAGDANEQKFCVNGNAIIHKAPVRFEWYGVDAAGARHCDKKAAKPLQAILNAVLDTFENAPAKGGA